MLNVCVRSGSNFPQIPHRIQISFLQSRFRVTFSWELIHQMLPALKAWNCNVIQASYMTLMRLTQHHNGGSKYSYTSLRLNTRKARIIFLADTFSRDFAPEVNVSEFFHELKKIDHVVSLPSVTYDGIKLKVHQWSILSSKNYGRLYSAKPCCRSQTAHWSPAVTWIPIS